MQNKQRDQEQPNRLRCAIYTHSANTRQEASSAKKQEQFCRDAVQPFGRIVRAAIYTRSAVHDPASLARQQDLCCIAAAEHSWHVDDLIFSDSDKSRPTKNEREGLSLLLQRAEEQPRPFDHALVESICRLDRNMTVITRIVDTLASYGIGVYFTEDRLDSRDPTFRAMISCFATFDQRFIRTFRERVLKRSHQRVRFGNTSGGRYFGYESYRVDIPGTGKIKRETRAKLRIIPEEAETIRRVYRLFADGLTMQAIARRLTSEGVPGPGKDSAPLWNAGLVSRLLRREHYSGLVVWNQTARLRDPLPGRIMKRRKPEDEIVRLYVPDLRIVGADLATALNRRLQNVHAGKL